MANFDVGRLNVLRYFYLSYLKQQVISLGGSVMSFVSNRREEIMRRLEREGRVEVAGLARDFGVSSLTIRRDLDALAGQGLVTRSYGHAMLAPSALVGSEAEVERRKQAIAEYAASLVENGDIVFINTGTTALGILEHVVAENVTFVTNNGRALDAQLPPASTMILTGGEIRVPKWSMTGEFALASIRAAKADKCFLSCSGISSARGLTTNVAQEMRVNELMLERSDYHVVLADSSKVDVDSSFVYGLPGTVDLLITDSGMTDEQVAAFKAAGVRGIVRVDA